jgi:hypothetical protein
MKFFIFLSLLLLVPFTANAYTPVTKETANVYFKNCTAQTAEQKMSVQAQNMLCACTAARLTQFFSMEDMATMTNPQSEPAAQRGAFNKMLINIYSPCMEEPTREFHYNACISNPQTSQYGEPAKICRCMADAVAAHIQVHGPTVFEELVARNPNIVDPMAALTNDPSFQTFAQSKLLACLQ